MNPFEKTILNKLDYFTIVVGLISIFLALSNESIQSNEGKSVTLLLLVFVNLAFIIYFTLNILKIIY